MSEETKTIDIDELLPRIENLGGVASRAEVAAAIRQLRARCDRLQAAIEHRDRELKVVAAELEKAAVELAAERQETLRVQQERDAARKALDELRVECDQWKELGTEALDAVDRVFQVDSTKPPPLLPDFLLAGESKFSGVVKLAEAYRELQAQIKTIGDVKLTTAQLAGIAEWLRAEKLRAEPTPSEQEAMAQLIGLCPEPRRLVLNYIAWIKSLLEDANYWRERQLAERPTLEVLKKALRTMLMSQNPGQCIAKALDHIGGYWDRKFIQHFAPLAADGNSPAIPESSEGPRHSCGLSGFNPMLGDKCEACEPTAKSISELCRTSDGMLPADSPPAASAEWVKETLDAVWRRYNELRKGGSSVIHSAELAMKQVLRAALARIGPPKCERCEALTTENELDFTEWRQLPGTDGTEPEHWERATSGGMPLCFCTAVGPDDDEDA